MEKGLNAISRPRLYFGVHTAEARFWSEQHDPPSTTSAPKHVEANSSRRWGVDNEDGAIPHDLQVFSESHR